MRTKQRRVRPDKTPGKKVTAASPFPMPARDPLVDWVHGKPISADELDGVRSAVARRLTALDVLLYGITRTHEETEKLNSELLKTQHAEEWESMFVQGEVMGRRLASSSYQALIHYAQAILQGTQVKND